METGLHNLAAIVFEGGVSNADEPSLTIQTIVNIWSKGRARKPITGHGIVKVLDVRMVSAVVLELVDTKC